MRWTKFQLREDEIEYLYVFVRERRFVGRRLISLCNFSTRFNILSDILCLYSSE